MYDSQKGFTLIEVMVGLVIGMLGTLIVAQAFTNNEARKRATTSTADAQANGGIALYMLERDAKAAGWGMTATGNSYAGCTNVYAYCDGSAGCGGATGALTGLDFAPMLITDGGSNPDTLTIQYFADPNVASALPSGSTTVRRKMPQPSSELDVASAAVCSDGDLALVSSGAPLWNCTLMKITQVQEESSKLQHNPGAKGEYNPSGNFYTTNTWPKYEVGANVSCFKAAVNGPVFRKVYSVKTATRELQRSDNSQDPVVTNELVMPEVIDLQAQYGVAAANSQAISSWVDPSTTGWTNPAPANWRRVKAIRVALVTRISQYERPAAGANCAATTALATSWGAISTVNYPADWQCYRYRVFETVIPLRNVIWGRI